MNFNQWKKLSKHRQKMIVKNWDIQKQRDFKCIGFLASNGRNTVAFLDFYTSNRNQNLFSEKR